MSAFEPDDIDELLKYGQMTAAAEDSRKTQSAASPTTTLAVRGSRSGHGSVSSPTSDRDHAGSQPREKGSPRESHHDSSRGSPRNAEYSRRSSHSQRYSHADYEENDRRGSHHDRTDRSDRHRHRRRSRSPDSSRHRLSYRERSTSPAGDRPRRREYRDRSRSRDRHDYYERRAVPYSGRGNRRGGPYGSSRDAPGPATDGSDNRSVFVQQLAMRVKDAHLHKFFSEAGPVDNAVVIVDRNTGRSKGFGYVQFTNIESVERAVGLTGRKLLDVPVIVSMTDADKNRAAKKTEGPSAQNSGVPFHRLYVGNINFNIDANDLKELFGTYGEIAIVELSKDENGRSKGYAFVQFIEPEDAKSALTGLNGYELASRPLRVGLGRDDRIEDTSTQRLGQTRAPSNQQGSDFSGAGGRTANARANTDRDTGRGANGASGALDDGESGGVNYSNYSRHALMRRLAREEDNLPLGSLGPNTGNRTTVASSSNAPAVYKSNPSRCVLVKNAYNEADETAPDWVQELETDFTCECSESYGEVVFCALYRDSPDGEIYLKFKDVQGGDKAIKGLSGRNFGGRMLRAEPIVDAMFNTIFPTAANL